MLIYILLPLTPQCVFGSVLSEVDKEVAFSSISVESLPSPTNRDSRPALLDFEGEMGDAVGHSSTGAGLLAALNYSIRIPSLIVHRWSPPHPSCHPKTLIVDLLKPPRAVV